MKICFILYIFSKDWVLFGGCNEKKTRFSEISHVPVNGKFLESKVKVGEEANQVIR